jgi:hypothetical protein
MQGAPVRVRRGGKEGGRAGPAGVPVVSTSTIALNRYRPPERGNSQPRQPKRAERATRDPQAPLAPGASFGCMLSSFSVSRSLHCVSRSQRLRFMFRPYGTCKLLPSPTLARTVETVSSSEISSIIVSVTGASPGSPHVLQRPKRNNRVGPAQPRVRPPRARSDQPAQTSPAARFG